LNILSLIFSERDEATVKFQKARRFFEKELTQGGELQNLSGLGRLDKTLSPKP
jgi:hypothetical protein